MADQQFRPDVPVYAEDGSYYKIGTTDNPVAKTKITNRNDVYRFNGTVFGEAQIIPGLRFRSTFSVAKNFNFTHQYYPVFYRKVIIITIIPVKLYGEVTNRYVPFGIIH